MYGIEGSTGLIYAWGSGTSGTLGNGTATNVSAPTVVSGGRSYKQVTAASQTACALEASTGYAWTWGLNNSGSLGNNSLTASNVPVSVWGARSYKQVTIAFDILAAIEGSTGYIWTWGSNVGGGLGNGGVATANASSPVQVSGGKSFSKVASTSDSFYAVEGSTGFLYAWGNNSFGQCGTGSVPAPPVSFYNVPVQVASGKSWKFIPSQPSDTPLGVALDSSNVLYYWVNHSGVTSMVQASLGAGYAVSGSPVSIARYNPKW
jgi:alpha-tubulin suppressor-like RCC1 family protein